MRKINIVIKVINIILVLLILGLFIGFPITRLKNFPKYFFNAYPAYNQSIDNSIFEKLDKAIENYLK